jgi:hypothetical protein
MGASHRHHYIPQFLIKNFSDEDGLIYVFNKQTGRIDHKQQRAKSIFFEWDRNTIKSHEAELDNIEQLYSALDNKFASDLKKVLESKHISENELVSIIILAHTLKWRIPLNDHIFNEVKNNTSLEELSISIKPKNHKGNIDEEAIKEIEASEIFKESKRVILPLLPFLKNPERLMSIYKNCYINTNLNFTSLIGDCPIIEKTGTGMNDVNSFIFLLSSTDTFVYKPDSKKKVTSILFYLNKDLATFHLSEKYVACKSKDYLEKIASYYNQMKIDNKIEDIVKFIFDFV